MELDKLQATVDKNNEKLAALRAKKDDLEAQIAKIKDQIRPLQAENDPLEAELRALTADPDRPPASTIGLN